jgi:hypothetical protein
VNKRPDLLPVRCELVTLHSRESNNMQRLGGLSNIPSACLITSPRACTCERTTRR